MPNPPQRLLDERYAALAARLLALGNRPLRVLIVDDDALFVEALHLALDTDGRLDVVGCAHGGRDAVRLAALRRPDAVLIDLNMPVMDGAEATRLIRRASPSSRVIVVSSSDSRADVERALAAGACRYVTKGASLDELVAAAYADAAAVLPLRPSGSVTYEERTSA